MLLLLFSLSLATTAIPQCNYRLESSAALRSSYLDAVVEGNDLWTATGYGVQLFDRSSDPPRLVTLAAVPGVTRSIDVRSGVAYAGSGTAVYVLRRAGAGLEIVGSVESGATVNDVVASSGTLFVATTNGLLFFDRTDPLHPAGGATLPTSSANVLSIARSGESVLYAADGDESVERFSITSGAVPAGALAGLPRSASVNVAGGRVFVSDGLQTRMFAGDGTSIATFSTGATTVAHHAGDVFFGAGIDRRFRALDLTLAAQPVELYAADIIPTGGNANRIGALVAAGGRLYVAGGDAGLLTLDTAGFAPPFPLRAHPFGPKTSSVDSPSAIFVGDASGGLAELTRFTSGSLAVGRTWGGSQTHLVHDFADDFLLTSSGATLTYWATRSGTPAAVSSAAFAGAIRSAVLRGSSALVLLGDGTLWSADLSRQQPVPARITLPAAQFLARSGNGVALAGITEEGITTVRFHAGGDLAAPPAEASIPGAAQALALAGSLAATFTFRGITVADFSGSAPSEFVLPQSNTDIVQDLAIDGARLLDLTSSSLRVWDLAGRRLLRTFALPSGGRSLSLHPAAPIATVLTDDGVVTISYEASTRQPEQIAIAAGNVYATKIVASTARLFAFRGHAIDVYETLYSGAPDHLASISVPGAIDLAASDTTLFVLFSNGTVTGYSHHGHLSATTTIDEGVDAVPLAIFAARGAPWVSFSRGCLTTGCEERTLVLDPSSLVHTATVEGGISDLVTAGSVAHALVHIPPRREIRAYDLADARHPASIASRAREGSAAALARHGANVIALGIRLFTYAHPALTKVSEELTPAAVSAATRLAVEGDCAVITGRSPAAEVYRWAGAQWAPAETLPLPGPVRSVARQPGRVFILTDYSIELWSGKPAPAPPRRRAAP